MSSPSPSISSHRRRSSQSTTNTTSESPAAVASSSYTGPAPSIRCQLFALSFVLFLGFLQFFPATHFRDPFDPLRKWVPYQSNNSTSLNSNTIVSWMDCINLQVLAVLINSTLSRTSSSDVISFTFFVPEDQKENRVLYYKLKVLFPDQNLQFIGQEMVKKEIMSAYASFQLDEHSGPSLAEIAPYIIPFLHSQLTKFIYISPNSIFQGNVDELVKLDLNGYPIGVYEDCTERGTRSNRLHPAIATAIYYRHFKISEIWRGVILEYGESLSFCSENGKPINLMNDFKSRFGQYLPLSLDQVLGLH